MKVVRETTKSTQFFRMVDTLPAGDSSLDTVDISCFYLNVLWPSAWVQFYDEPAVTTSTTRLGLL